MKPNLFLIGASKCGTTFLHSVLSQHYQVCMSATKEPSHFIKPNWNQLEESYLKLFRPDNKTVLMGESSPIYSETTYFKDVPRRIFEYNPRSKILYIVREPFSRFQSVFRQTLSTGHWFELKYYENIMPLNYVKAIMEYPPFLEATKYYTHIKNYLKYFPKSSIDIILFDDLVSNTKKTLNQIFRKLEVDENINIDFSATEKNSGENKQVFNPWPLRVRRIVPEFMMESMPKSIIKIFVRLIEKLTYLKMPSTHIKLEEKEKIRNILLPEIKGLYKLLKIENDPWNFIETDGKL